MACGLDRHDFMRLGRFCDVCVWLLMVGVILGGSAVVWADASVVGGDGAKTSDVAGGDEAFKSLIGGVYEQAVREAIVGRWQTAVRLSVVRLTLTVDGRFVLGREGQMQGAYHLAGQTLTLQSEGGEVAYGFSLTGEELKLSGGDLEGAVTLTRVPDTQGYARRLFEFTPESIRTKLYRILLVAVVAVVCRLVIGVLRSVSQFIIFSDWWVLRFLYQRRKNRAMTLHSLGLNITKYVLYLVAAGFVLTELGINFTTYLASLSVIGLAIAFGSQGLVQDMVTGLFIIVEGQFDVGSMVEIGPQPGIVEEIGLRMTRLRNYMGQEVFVPNRNISLVYKYAQGMQEASVDIAVGDAESVGRAAAVLETFVGDVVRQFDRVIDCGRVVGPMALEGGEYFVRLGFSIWPKQEWVIEQQVAVRGREVLKAAGIEVPGDRVAVFYCDPTVV